MRSSMAGGDPSHFTLPGIDQLAPDLKRIIDEALFGSIWVRPQLDIRHRCISTISALMALGQLPLLRRHIERCLNLGMTPDEVVEVFIQLTFYVGVPAAETAMRTTKEIFEERGITFTPAQIYDPQQTADELYQTGVNTHEKHMGEVTIPETSTDPDSQEMQLERLINEYHWGAIYTRPNLDEKSRGHLRPFRHDRPGNLRPADTPPYRRRPKDRHVAPRDIGGLHPGNRLRRIFHHPHRHADSPFCFHRAGSDDLRRRFHDSPVG